MSPFVLFEKWFAEEKEISHLKFPNACCLSTIGLDGYPNSRFVSLKEIYNESFAITGSLSSRKGLEIESCQKVALAFWWATSKRQVRVQGDVFKIPDPKIETYFRPRSQDSKIISTTFDQGLEIESIEHLKERYLTERKRLDGKSLQHPKNWGGFYIKPIRLEFMEFKDSRLHERKLFKNIENKWREVFLQP